MEAPAKTPSKTLSRISVSLPDQLLTELDAMVAEKGYDSRSQAINTMLYQALVEHKRDHGNEIMAGIVTLFYDNTVPGLQKELADTQYRYIDEVISSLHVHLMHNQTMEVILVQGPARKLQVIANKLTSERGVISGQMHLIAALIPQLHPFIKSDKPKRDLVSG